MPPKLARQSTSDDVKGWLDEHTEKCRNCRWGVRKFLRQVKGNPGVDLKTLGFCGYGLAIMRQLGQRLAAELEVADRV